MKHIWSVLCKKSVIDADTNNISLNEVLEEVTFNIPLDKDLKLPANFVFDYEIISFWTTPKKTGGKFYVEMEFIDPDKKILNKLEQEITTPENRSRLRTRIKANGLNVTKDGDYTLKVKAKEKKSDTFKTLTEIPLTIHIKRTMSAQ
jgi:hypothetical protein